jgi:hypothetical protein
MPMICPKCNIEIEHASYEKNVTEWGYYTPDNGYDFNDSNVNELYLRCPDCEYYFSEEEIDRLFNEFKSQPINKIDKNASVEELNKKALTK